MRFNGFAIAALREEAPPGSLFEVSLDVVFGAPKTNNYTRLSGQYQRSHKKPDKHHSHLPTVLSLVGDCRGKTVADLGCGSGFYTEAISAQGAGRVIGMDNSQAQLDVAMTNPPQGVEYVLGDIFVDPLPGADTVVAPYVVNYAKSVQQLQELFRKLHRSLPRGGKVVLVVDLPSCTDLKRFGAVKTALGPKEDGTRIRIDLFDDDQAHICALYATYFTEETLVASLEELGFVDVTWHAPIISVQGLHEYGKEFWEGYTEDPQVGYLTALKT